MCSSDLTTGVDQVHHQTNLKYRIAKTQHIARGRVVTPTIRQSKATAQSTRITAPIFSDPAKAQRSLRSPVATLLSLRDLVEHDVRITVGPTAHVGHR